MENFYNKVIFDISQLIINKNYKRAITLGQFLFNKGFRTTQLIVVISYAHKMVYGTKSAIEFLLKYTETETNSMQTTQIPKITSPLLQLAFTEYHIENQNRNKALQNIQNLINISNQFSQYHNQTRLYQLIQQISKNKQQKHDQIVDNNQVSQFTQQSEIDHLTNQINSITQSYIQQRDQLLSLDQIQPTQIASKYGHYYLQYDDIKRKILTLLSQQIKHDSIHIVPNKKIKRKQNKFLKDTSSSNKKQKLQNKNSIENETKEQYGQPKTLTNNKSQKKQFIMPSNKIDQLQSLLSHVNGFIVFFKNRIKDYGASRVKYFQSGDQQTYQADNKL